MGRGQQHLEGVCFPTSFKDPQVNYAGFLEPPQASDLSIAHQFALGAAVFALSLDK